MRLFPALLAALSLTLALPAAARPPGRHLPVGAAHDDQEVLRLTLEIPAVRAALARCRSRGYLRRPEADTVLRSATSPVVAVFLGFEKPDLRLPPHQIGAPLVIVATRLDSSGRPRTKVMGGLVVADRHARRLLTADEASTGGADASFAIESDDVGGDQGQAEPVLLDDGFTVDALTQQQQQDLTKYLGCVGWGSLGCFSQILGQPIPIPQVIVIRTLACEVVVTLGCLSQIL